MSDMLWHGKNFPRSTPEDQGIPSKAILSMLKQVQDEKIELHSLHIIRNNHMITDCVARPFTEESPHRIYSSAKGIQALAVMFLIQEGKLSLQDRVTDIFAEEKPDYDKMDPRMRDMTVLDLLTMSNGHPRSGFYEMRQTDNWIKAFLEQPLVRKPGTVFEYNNAPPHLICCVPRAITGQNMIEYLTPRLFEPLEMYDLCEFSLDPRHPEDLEPTSQCVSPIDFVKLAQFFLQHGSWNGTQLLRADLCDLIGKRYFPTYHMYTDTHNRYGFGLFSYGNHFGGYHFSGGYGQQAIVVPELQLAIEFTANEIPEHVSRLFALLDEHVIRECHESPMEASGEDAQALSVFAANYNLAPKGTHETSFSKEIDGRTLLFDENAEGIESVTFFAKDDLTMKIVRNGQRIVSHCGWCGAWLENVEYPLKESADSMSPVIKGYEPAKILGYSQNQPCLLSAAWTAENTLQINARRMDLMCMVTQAFTFAGKTASVRIHYHFLPGSSEKNPDIILTGRMM